MADTYSPSEQQADERLAHDVTSAAAALQRSIHAAVEAGLKVAVRVESMRHVGHHYAEPLVEVDVERVIRLP
jgi:hypothetical protein